MPSRRPDLIAHLFMMILPLLFLTAAAGALSLPDLVLPRNRRPDTQLPSAYPDPSVNWKPLPPDSRRIYKLSTEAEDHDYSAPGPFEIEEAEFKISEGDSSKGSSGAGEQR